MAEGLCDERAVLPAKAREHDRGDEVLLPWPERREVRGCSHPARRTPVERREHEGPWPGGIAREDPAELDEQAGAAARLVGRRRGRGSVMVRRDHEELGPRSTQHADDVRTLVARGLEVLDLDLADADVAQLGGHVLGGGAGAGRPERVRAEGGERGSVAQDRLAVDRGGDGENGDGERHRGGDYRRGATLRPRSGR